MTAFIGREAEFAKLEAVTRIDAASLIVIKGRRRVGKSRLATEFAAHLPGYKAVNLTGLAPDAKTTAAAEREDFALQMSQSLNIPPPPGRMTGTPCCGHWRSAREKADGLSFWTRSTGWVRRTPPFWPS